MWWKLLFVIVPFYGFLGVFFCGALLLVSLSFRELFLTRPIGLLFEIGPLYHRFDLLARCHSFLNRLKMLDQLVLIASINWCSANFFYSFYSKWFSPLQYCTTVTSLPLTICYLTHTNNSISIDLPWNSGTKAFNFRFLYLYCHRPYSLF